MAPKTMKQWTVQGQFGFDSLIYNHEAAVPELGERDVLVKFHAISLNYRDTELSRALTAAGIVEAVGKHVHRFKPGDRVATLFNQGHLGWPLDSYAVDTGVGGLIYGTLREYGAYDEQGLVKVPENLNWLEASTLSCAAVTAWNALYGLESKALKQGETVLAQGTGGVSIFAVQFAKAAGARVIATTSSAEKVEMLKKLGADNAINYKEDPNWGETAKKFTPNGVGMDRIIEVGGLNTMKRSLNAIKIEGVITVIGFRGGMLKDAPSLVECLFKIITVRGVFVGSRLQFEEMNRAIEVNDIKPVVDRQVFTLDEVKDAYQYLWDQKHVGKLCIKIA